MKRIAVLVASLMALNQLLISKSKDLNRCCGLILTSSQNVSSKNQHHYSHGSASHYSAVQYVKKIDKNDINRIILKPEIISNIKKLIEKKFVASYERCECSDIQVVYTNLLSINTTAINKKCYSLKFLLQYYTENGIHGHGYYHFYLTENSDTYYKIEPHYLKGNIENADWLKQILYWIK
jgi:uncharacterized protein (UPF0371 family)